MTIDSPRKEEEIQLSPSGAKTSLSLPRMGDSTLSTTVKHDFYTGGGRGAIQGTAEDVIIKQAANMDENRIVLFKKGKQIGKGYYIVEISSNNSSLFIATYDVESPESFLIELSEEKALHILGQF